MNRRRTGLIGGAVGLAAAAAGATLIADRKVTTTRRTGIAGQDDLADPPFDRSGYLEADDGISLYYEENGPADAPVTVVFSHGFCLSRNDFLFQRKALVSNYGDRIRVVSYDHRSHGKSERCPTRAATIDQLGADLYSVIATLVPTGQLVIVGHSMGGMTIMALADAHSDLFGTDSRISGVVLASTSTGKLASITMGLPATLARVRGPVLDRLLRGARSRADFVERGRARVTDLAWVFVKKTGFGGTVDPALVEYVTRLIGATPVEVIADFYPTLMDHDKLDALAELSQTRVVIICGEDDVLTPPDHSREIADALPHAEVLFVAGAGHQVLMERPDLANVPLLRLVDQALLDAKPRRRGSKR